MRRGRSGKRSFRVVSKTRSEREMRIEDGDVVLDHETEIGTHRTPLRRETLDTHII